MQQHADSPHSNNTEVRSKTAAAATVMNIVLTGTKFLLYVLSGSMAILAEAWHSFSDIATSLLVLVAIRHSIRKKRTGSEETAGDEVVAAEQSAGMEVVVSIAIGLFLTVVAVMLLVKALFAEAVVINRPLISGIVFLVFSAGSYFIYRFETRVGKQEGSIGLVSDGMHARADMVASLLTGFSLILYAMGLDIDRPVAGLIALFILSFAVETLFNAGLVLFRRNQDYLFTYRSYEIVAFLFDRNVRKKAYDAFNSVLALKTGSKKTAELLTRGLLAAPVVVIIAAYCSTAFFTVAVRERAVIERFGRPTSTVQPVGPGLHTKLPWPIDRVKKIRVAAIRELNIGNIGESRQSALLWTRRHGTEEPFLSGDNNLFYPYIVLHYRVHNIFQYLYAHADPVALMREVGYQVATAVFARETFYDIATAHRKALEREMLDEVQRTLDALQSGVEVLTVNFKDIHPPLTVADSFERVIAGYQEKQQIINNALGHTNKVLPEARGTAARTLEEARGYSAERVNTAQGTAGRFIGSLPASPPERTIAMSRLYLDTMLDIFKTATPVVIDTKAGKPELWSGFLSSQPGVLQGGTTP